MSCIGLCQASRILNISSIIIYIYGMTIHIRFTKSEIRNPKFEKKNSLRRLELMKSLQKSGENYLGFMGNCGGDGPPPRLLRRSRYVGRARLRRVNPLVQLTNLVGQLMK